MSSCEPADRLPRLRVRTPVRAALAASLAALVCSCGAPPPRPSHIQHEGVVGVRIATPKPGSQLTLRSLQVPVRGRARAANTPRVEPLDVFVLVDVSEATKLPSGWDVDRDGETGFDPHRVLADLEPGGMLCTDPEDDVLHAEFAALGRLVDHLDPSTDRLGLAFFASGARASGRARDDALLPLGSPFERLRGALVQWFEAPRPILSPAAARRIRLTLRARAGRAAPPPPAGVEAVTFAFSGSASPSAPLLKQPDDVLAWLAATRDGGTLDVANASLGERSSDAFLARDGRFSASIPVRAGPNRVRVRVREAGRSGAAVFDFDVRQQQPSHWELLQDLEETQRRNQQLIRLIESVQERRAGDLEIRLER